MKNTLENISCIHRRDQSQRYLPYKPFTYNLNKTKRAIQFISFRYNSACGAYFFIFNFFFLPQIGDRDEDSACIKVVEGKEQTIKSKPKRGTGDSITIKLILQQFHTGRNTRVGVNTAHCMKYCSTAFLNRSFVKSSNSESFNFNIRK